MKKLDLRILAPALLAAMIYRLDFLLASEFRIDGDEAIVGLMAKHILEGRGVPTFFYGQHYMGSLEALLVSAAFWLFGISTAVLKLVPALLSLLLLPLIYRLALQFAGRFAAACAVWLMALPPVALLEWVSRARGGFVEIILIGGSALLCCLRYLKREQSSFAALLALGFVLGVGWWVNNQILYFFVPIGFAMLLRWRGVLTLKAAQRLKEFAALVLGFFAGSTPFWIYNFKHDFASFGIFSLVSPQTAAQHFSGLVTQSLPILLGARRFWQAENLFEYADLLIAVLYVLLFCLLIAARHKEIGRLMGKMQLDFQKPVELLFVFILGAFLIFSFSSFGYLVQAPRYLLPIYLAIYVLLGITLELLPGARRLPALSILLLLLFLNLASFYLGGRAIPGEPLVFSGERVSKDHAQLINWLYQKQITWLRTNYWIGYRLAFETSERVKFLILFEPYQARIPEYELAGQKLKDKLPMLLVPEQAKLVGKALDVLGVDFSAQELSGYRLFYDFKPRQDNLQQLDPQQIVISAQDGSGLAAKASDADISTRWGSGRAQAPGMQLVAELSRPAQLRGLLYDLGSWTHDYPRGLQIELENEKGERVLLLAPDDYQAVRYYQERESAVFFRFATHDVKRVIFTQTGSDPVFDWSIAELKLYS